MVQIAKLLELLGMPKLSHMLNDLLFYVACAQVIWNLNFFEEYIKYYNAIYLLHGSK